MPTRDKRDQWFTSGLAAARATHLDDTGGVKPCGAGVVGPVRHTCSFGGGSCRLLQKERLARVKERGKAEREQRRQESSNNAGGKASQPRRKGQGANVDRDIRKKGRQ